MGSLRSAADKKMPRNGRRHEALNARLMLRCLLSSQVHRLSFSKASDPVKPRCAETSCAQAGVWLHLNSTPEPVPTFRINGSIPEHCGPRACQWCGAGRMEYHRASAGPWYGLLFWVLRQWHFKVLQSLGLTACRVLKIDCPAFLPLGRISFGGMV